MRIREVIEQKGMTTKDVADILGISVSALNQNISGNPSVKVLEKIAGALNVPIWQLCASKEDVGGEVCPHCGMPIKIKIEKGE